MHLSYDKRAGVAYLRLRPDTDDPDVVSSEPFRPPGARNLDDRLVLDFDDEGRLVGIEFLTPELRLLPSVLAGAQQSIVVVPRADPP